MLSFIPSLSSTLFTPSFSASSSPQTPFFARTSLKTSHVPHSPLHLPPTAKLPDVIIIGAGIASLSTAFELSLSGASVTLYHSPTTHPPAALAAAGMLAPYCENISPPLRFLAFASLHQYPHFIARLSTHTNIDPAYTSRSDFLNLYVQGDDTTSTHLSGDQARLIEPALGQNVIAAARVKGDAHIDNRRLVEALRAACKALGVDMRERRVQQLLLNPSGASVDGIVVEGEGVVSAAHYILAAGAWSTRLLPSLPVRPVKGQILSLRPPPGDRSINRLKHVLHGHHVYIVPKMDRGEYYVGATVEEGTFQLGNTAGGVAKLLTSAAQLVPGFADYDIAEMWSGFRPATPDLMPILGSTEYTNLTAATGYYRNGILLAPLTAKIVAATALGKIDQLPLELRELLPSFSMARFLGGGIGSTTTTSASHAESRAVSLQEGTVNAPPRHAVRSEGETESAVGEFANFSGYFAQNNGNDTTAFNNSTFSSATSSESYVAPSVIEASQRQPLVYRILPDGNQEPVEPSEDFIAKIKASSQVIAAKGGEKVQDPGVSSRLNSTNTAKNTATPGASTAPGNSSRASLSTVQQKRPNMKSMGEESDDAYEDVMRHRGDKEDEIMSKAMADNRAFGRKQSPLESGVALSLSDEEVSNFDKALAQGVRDFEEFTETFNPNHPSVVASQVEKASLAKSHTEQSGRINGAFIPIVKDGSSDAPRQSDGYF